MEDSSKKVIKKRGTVIEDKSDKTVVVSVQNLKTHSKYKKKYLSTKKYKVHDEENRHKKGDVIEIIPTRPISKGKFYKVA